MRIENGFDVSAPPEAAWRLLNDVPRIVPCMPGAELTEVVGDDAWKATMRVKLGPISLSFGTDIVRESVDEAARSVVLSANARELKGRGGAQATIESTLTEVAGGTHVTIGMDLALQGGVAQYGRSVVADVAGQMTKRFAENLSEQLAESGPEAPTPVAPAQAEPVSGLRLGLGALWRVLVGRFRRRGRNVSAER